MPRTTSTLSNCYTPSPHIPPPPPTTSHKPHPKTITPHARPTGEPSSPSTTPTRTSKSLRRLHISTSTLSSSSGSSLVEIGNTKVLCSVHGPRPSASSSSGSGSTKGFNSGGVLNCDIKYAPHFGVRPEERVMKSAKNLDGYGGAEGGGGGGSNREEVELSARLHDALSPSVPLHLLRKSVVDVYVMVLQNDSGGAGVLGACVMAASLALVDAGVEVYDMVVCCCVAVVPRSVVEKEDGGEGGASSTSSHVLLADPTESEIQVSDGVVTLAMMPNWKEITFWDQVGRLPVGVASDAADLCRDGCGTMQKFVRKALVGGS